MRKWPGYQDAGYTGNMPWSLTECNLNMHCEVSNTSMTSCRGREDCLVHAGGEVEEHNLPKLALIEGPSQISAVFLNHPLSVPLTYIQTLIHTCTCRPKVVEEEVHIAGVVSPHMHCCATPPSFPQACSWQSACRLCPGHVTWSKELASPCKCLPSVCGGQSGRDFTAHRMDRKSSRGSVLKVVRLVCKTDMPRHMSVSEGERRNMETQGENGDFK